MTGDDGRGWEGLVVIFVNSPVRDFFFLLFLVFFFCGLLLSFFRLDNMILCLL